MRIIRRIATIIPVYGLIALSIVLTSPAAAQPSYRLLLTAEGDGVGSIQVEPGGLVCSPPCAYTFPAGSQVTATAIPAVGSVFTSWLGDRCYDAQPCTLTLFGDVTLRAGFGLPDAFGVTYTLPANGNTGVAPSSQPQIFFNRVPVVGPNLGGITLATDSGEAVAFTTVLRAAERRLVILPSSSLQQATTYTLSIPEDAVLDEAGDMLAAAVQLSFTTAVPGTPRMHLRAYPKFLMEGATTRASVWFESPSDEDRVVTLSQSPPGELIGPSEIVIPAGQVLGEVALRARLNHGSTSDVAVTLAASEASAGQQSIVVEVKNDTPIHGTSLVFQAASVTSETDGDGVFESGETARVLFEVANFGAGTVCNVVLTFRVLNTRNMRILGGTPFQCAIGCINSGQGRNCTRDFLANEELPTGTYYVEVAGTSTVNSILDQPGISVVNRFTPDLTLGVGPITSNVLPAGTVVNLKYTPRNSGDGFVTPPPLPAPGLPYFRVFLETEGQTQVLYDRVYAEARGDSESSQTLELPIVYPSTPGTHTLRAVVDPDGVVAEGNESNNQAELRLIHVAEPNQAPVLASIGGPWTVSVGSSFCLALSASDPNGDALTFAISPLPTGATLTQAVGGTASFCWSPSSTQGPASWNLSFTVADDASPPLTDSETVTVEVLNSADLVLTGTADQNPVIAGETVTLALTVHNGGPSAANQTTLAGLLPAAAVSAVTTGCAEDPLGVPTCSLGTVPAGGVATVSVALEIDPAATGALQYTATVSSTTPEGAAGQETVTITRPIRAEADLSISKDDGALVARPGQALVYAINVQNHGPSDAPSATVLDLFPPELETCSWVCSGTGSATCSIGPIVGPIDDAVSIPAGAALHYLATCTVAASSSTAVVNEASVQPHAPAIDPELSNNAAQDVDQPEQIFSDGFETGDTSRWSAIEP